MQGSRTIEYTEYAPPVTSILQGNSWRNEFIDVFVDGDDELFQQSVKRLLSEGKKIEIFKGGISVGCLRV